MFVAAIGDPNEDSCKFIDSEKAFEHMKEVTETTQRLKGPYFKGLDSNEIGRAHV